MNFNRHDPRDQRRSRTRDDVDQMMELVINIVTYKFY